MKLKLSSPFKVPFTISQKYSENFNDYYHSHGLKGHGAWDMVAPYKTPIYAVVDSYCYSQMNKDNSDLKRYRAVYTLWQNGDKWYEISYGHLWDIDAKPKTYLKAGDLIGTEGNTGNVFVGGVEPTYEQRQNGAGAHLHFQMREVKPVDSKISGKMYLSDMHGTLKYQGKYWEMLNYDNGFNGCIDPAPFFEQEQFKFTQTLKFGSTGKEVVELQKRLGVIQTGLFFTLTLKAVKDYQAKNGLTPDGVVGPLTRAKLNNG